MRSLLILAVLTAGGCSRPAAEFSFPQQVADWSLSSTPQESPALPPAKTSRQAVYKGEPPVTLVIHEMPTEPSAFESMQKWRTAPGKLAFYKGRYFAVAESPGADARTLDRFVAAAQRQLP